MAGKPSGHTLGGNPASASGSSRSAENAIATVAEPNNRSERGLEVDTHLAQHLNAGTRGRIHNVARRQNYVNRSADAARHAVDARRSRRLSSADRDGPARPPR